MNKYNKILEFDKILKLIEQYIVLDDNIERLNNIELMNDLDTINRALAEVDEAMILKQRLGRFPLYFRTRIENYLSKTSKNGILSAEELLQVSKFMDTIRSINNYYDECLKLELDLPNFKQYIDELVYNKTLNQNIKQIINQFGEINDNASPMLYDIRRRIKDFERNIQNKLREIISSNAAKLTDSIVSIRNDRYVIPVKNDYKNTVNGIVHDMSASGETVFIEPMAIYEMNNKLNSLYENANEEIYRILKIISSEIASEYNYLSKNYEIILNLDMIFSKAEYCLKINASRPNINKDGIVELYKCYHPLLNVENVVTNNVFIGKEYQAMIITGPNTGGKTVLLKTVGLLAIMVKAGILIPCDKSSNIMIFDNVFADIGDEQSIEQNLSTFSSHMKSVIDIMNNITNNSLVLLDELGSGTDPVEGSSLAIAIIDSLLSKKCLIIATSHYSELKMFAYNSKNLINASVEFNIETLMPTYKLLIGIPGQSNALKIASVLGLDKNIIDRANQFANEQSDENNNMLDKLISQSKLLDQKINELEEREKKINLQLIKANEKYEESIIDRNKLLREAEEQSRKIIDKTSKKINSLIDELESMKNKQDIKLHEISKIKGEYKTTKKEAFIEDEIIEKEITLQPKMSVFVENYGCYGIIIKEQRNNKFDVQIGNATISIDRKFLKPTKTITKPTLQPKNSPTIVPRKTVKMDLDLRGERYEAAKDKLEKYIDDAIYAGLTQINIIHGFGTGAIRELVKDTIKKYHQDIDSSRYGGAGEGGQGVTIIQLKK